MTALELQNELAKEIENITQDMVFKNVSNNKVKIKAFSQTLPLQELIIGEMESEQEFDPFPYCIVRILDGKTENNASTQEVKISIVIGLYDNNLKGQGCARILSIIDRIQARFLKYPILGKFVAKSYFKWELQDPDNDTFPYHFGIVEMIWDTPCIEREYR